MPSLPPNRNLVKGITANGGYYPKVKDMIINKDARAVSQIAEIWIDVMHRDVPERTEECLTEWWLQHQKEIRFAFEVLEGLGLVRRIGSEDEMIIWGPSREMEHLHRKSRRYYRRYHHRESSDLCDVELQMWVKRKNDEMN
jgi:hypothetical protein